MSEITLKQIKDYCSGRACKDCSFVNKKDEFSCIIEGCSPDYWDIDLIKEKLEVQDDRE